MADQGGSAIDALRQIFAQRQQAGGALEESRGSRAAPDPYAILPDEQIAQMAQQGDHRAQMEVYLRRPYSVFNQRPGQRAQDQHIQQNGRPTPSYLEPPMILEPGADRAVPADFSNPMTNHYVSGGPQPQPWEWGSPGQQPPSSPRGRR